MKSAQELAQMLGVNEATLRLWRAEAGIAAKARNVGYSPEEIAHIEQIAQSKRKSKPRKGDSANMPVIRAEKPKKATDSANRYDDIGANLDGSSAHINDDSAQLGMATAFIRGYSAQLERIESKIDALMALFDKAVIASRYIARKTVEDAVTDSAHRPAIPRQRPRRGNGDVPRLSEFAEAHGVPPRTANDHARMALIATKNVDLGNGKYERYVTHEQQAGVIAFWKSVSYPFKPCELCPHEEVQE